MTQGGRIIVDIKRQRLEFWDGSILRGDFPVSTARNGVGEEKNSGCTPRGKHYIRAKIGADAPPGAVFVGRRWTGELFDEALNTHFPNRDWILSRILWLCGREPGFNRLGHRDSMQRYIYIHGSPDAGVTGEPASHGCIRMTSSDVIELFSRVPVGTAVDILD